MYVAGLNLFVLLSDSYFFFESSSSLAEHVYIYRLNCRLRGFVLCCMLKPFTESCSLRRKSPLHLPVPQMTERNLEGKQKKFRWNSMEWKRSNMIQHVVFSDFFDEKKLESFCKSQRMKQAFLSGETWTWQRETLAKTNPRAARPHAVVQIERLQFDKHEATLAAKIACNDIKPDDPVWYHLDRFSKKSWSVLRYWI